MTVTLGPGHVYTNEDGVRYASVTSVIKQVGFGKSSDGAPPDRVENARRRGIAVEALAYKLMKNGWVDCPDDPEIRPRVEAFHRWMSEGWTYVDDQITVWDDVARIAGTADLLAFDPNGKPWLIDLKCTHQVEQPTGMLQLGAYGNMLPAVRATATLHIHTRLKGGKRVMEGVRFIEHDIDQCVDAWQPVREAWIKSQKLFDKARTDVEEMLTGN